MEIYFLLIDLINGPDIHFAGQENPDHLRMSSNGHPEVVGTLLACEADIGAVNNR